MMRVRGVVLLTRGPDGKALLAGCAGTDVQGMTDACLAELVSRGGSAHAEDWFGWALNRAPNAALMAALADLVASGKGGVTHPAVVQSIFDAEHPRLAARGDA